MSVTSNHFYIILFGLISITTFAPLYLFVSYTFFKILLITIVTSSFVGSTGVSGVGSPSCTVFPLNFSNLLSLSSL